MIASHSATWQDVALSLITALPGVIAALSSLKNGSAIQTLDDRQKLTDAKVDRVRARVGSR